MSNQNVVQSSRQQNLMEVTSAATISVVNQGNIDADQRSDLQSGYNIPVNLQHGDIMSEREEYAIANLEKASQLAGQQLIENYNDVDDVQEIGDLKYMTETEIIEDKKKMARNRDRATTERNLIPD